MTEWIILVLVILLAQLNLWLAIILGLIIFIARGLS